MHRVRVPEAGPEAVAMSTRAQIRAVYREELRGPCAPRIRYGRLDQPAGQSNAELRAAGCSPSLPAAPPKGAR